MSHGSRTYFVARRTYEEEQGIKLTPDYDDAFATTPHSLYKDPKEQKKKARNAIQPPLRKDFQTILRIQKR